MIELDGVKYISSTRFPALAERSAPYLLTRTLLGTLKLQSASCTCEQNQNFLLLPAQPQQRSNSEALKEFFLQFRVSSTSGFVRRTLSDNRAFYRDLLAEYAQYFLHTERKSHVGAFVFLYRILERLSYTLPFFYCAKQTEYRGTYRVLKKLFDESDGDLSFFKLFFRETGFLDRLILDSTFDITFSAQDSRPQRYFKAAKKRYQNFVIADDTTSFLKIQFRNVSEFMVEIRNGFLHARTGDGQNNLLASEIQDPDEFFGQLNPVFINFLAQITLHVLGKTYA